MFTQATGATIESALCESPSIDVTVMKRFATSRRAYKDELRMDFHLLNKV
jgi:hypothetical protein